MKLAVRLKRSNKCKFISISFSTVSCNFKHYYALRIKMSRRFGKLTLPVSHRWRFVACCNGEMSSCQTERRTKVPRPKCQREERSTFRTPLELIINKCKLDFTGEANRHKDISQLLRPEDLAPRTCSTLVLTVTRTGSPEFGGKDRKDKSERANIFWTKPETPHLFSLDHHSKKLTVQLQIFLQVLKRNPKGSRPS